MPTYGFNNLQNLYNTRVQAAGPAQVWTAIQESLTEYNRVLDGLTAAFVEKTVIAQEQIELPGSGTLQPLSDDGNPLPVLPSGNYQVAYPIHGAGTAWGDNRVARALMTVAEADRNTADAMRSDKDWMVRHILAALFDNVAWTFADKAGPDGTRGLGNITIQPLANGDTATYVRRGGAALTDTHYLAQAAAIADATNPYPTLRSELIEHPSNSGPFVAYVPSGLVATTAALTEFVEADDPDIRYGAANDTLSEIRAEILGPGDEVLGKTKTSNIWIVEWGQLPAGYILTVALNSGIKALKQREYDAPELQGFFPERADIDGNHLVTRMLRYTGFGVANRVAAAVMRIGNAVYAIPSGYDAPLAV